MISLAKFLIFAAFISVAYSRSLSRENSFEVQDSNCSCDWRYFKHYETKGCVVETTDSCGCPQKFTCPSNQTQQMTIKVCTYQNKEYKVGSKIISSDICQVCRCRDGVPPYISCVTRECPEITDTPDKDCHLVYKENRCCPVGVECFNETEVANNKTCEYNGRFYPFGSKIYPVDDPCQTCICDENWNDADNSSCYQQDCMFEKNKSKLSTGCIPVYHESRCCPVEFYCPSSHNLSISALSSNESSDNFNVSYDYQCTFAGQIYALGEELFMDNPCVKCSCNVPPDFTCVHQTCPPLPNKESCYTIHNSGECCPTYECMLGDAESHPDCPTPLCADSSCKIEIPFGRRCPSCVCRGCPTPLCADSSCRIEIPPGHDCPTCVCGENTSELEHNNLEQVQQINQNIEEQFENVQQINEPGGVSDDYSEDELQMMPIRMQESEAQSSVLEKMILPEYDQYLEGLRELEESSFEENFSTESVDTEDYQSCLDHKGNKVLHGDQFIVLGSDPCTQCTCLNNKPEMCIAFYCSPPENCQQYDTLNNMCCEFVCLDQDFPNKISENGTYSDKNVSNKTEEIPMAEKEILLDLDADDTYNKSEKVVQKRSDVSDAANNDKTEGIPNEQIASSQHETHEYNEGVEREGGGSDEKTTDFEDELENFKNKIFSGNKTIINEIIKINHVVKVPPGCPTPMCEGPWCKIGILPGHKCPTCICKRHIDSEP